MPHIQQENIWHWQNQVLEKHKKVLHKIQQNLIKHTSNFLS